MTARDLNHLRNLNDAPLIEPEPPEPFGRDSEPAPWPDDCLPGLMQQAANAIAEHVQVPAALSGFAVLAAVAHVAQRITDAARPNLPPCPSSLYLLALADSGDRKSTAFSAASLPVTQAEIEARQRHQQTSHDPDHKPQDPRTIYVDATLQRITSDMVKGSRPALSWSTDEGAQFFGGHTMKSDTRGEALGTLTRLYDGSGVQRDRIGQESVSGARFGVRLGVFMAAQQVAVAPSLHDPLLRGQGLLPRFLLAAPPSLAGRRFISSGSDGGVSSDRCIGRYWATLKRMNEHPETTDEYGSLVLPAATLTPEAERIWIGFYNTTEARLDRFTGDLAEGLKPFGSRAAENAARVAAVFAAWRYFEQAEQALTVSADDMDRACRLVDYSLSEWQRLSDNTALSGKERDARDLLAFLQRDSAKWATFTRKDVATKGYNPLRKDKDRRAAALDELVQRHWLTFDGTRFHLAEAPNPSVANANFANSANSGRGSGGAVSEVSGVSVSNPPKTGFAEPSRQAANEIDNEPPSYLPPLDTTQTTAPLVSSQSDDEWWGDYERTAASLTGTDDMGEF